MNYEFNLLNHVGVVAKIVCAAAAAHEGDDNTPSGPTGRGVKKNNIKNYGQSAILDFISAKFVKGYHCVSPYIFLSSMHGPAIVLCFWVT